MKLSKYGKRVVRRFTFTIVVVALVITGGFFIKNLNKSGNQNKEPEIIATLDDAFVNGLILKSSSFKDLTDETSETMNAELTKFIKSLQFSVLFFEITNKEDMTSLKIVTDQAKMLGLPLYLIDESNIIDVKDYKKHKIESIAVVNEDRISFGEYESKLMSREDLEDPLVSAYSFQDVLEGTETGYVFTDYESLKDYELEIGLVASNLQLIVKDKQDEESTSFTPSGDDQEEYFGPFETLASADEFFSNSKTAQIGVSNKPVIKGARIVAALASVLSDPNNVELIKSTAVKGSEFNVVGSVGSGEELAYETSTGDFIMAKYTEEIPAIKPFVFNGVSVEALEGYEVLKFKDTGSPLPYIFRDNNEIVITFVGSTYEGDAPVIEEGLFKGLEINNRAGNMELRIPLGEDQSWGYLVDLSDNIIKIRIKESQKELASYYQPLLNKVVVLDAGHGGKDPGSLNPNGGKSEAVVNLELSAQIEKRLVSLGATVVNTRTDDTFVSLWDRVNIFNDNNGDYFISVHHNASVNRSVHGVEMYYAKDDYKQMALSMAKDFSSITGRKDRGPYQWIQYVLRSSLGPSILIEAGFMSEDREFLDVQDRTKQILSAGTIADNIVKDLVRRIQPSE